MTRVAAIDCGTNSIRLLVSDVRDGEIHEVTRLNEIVRLGQGVDATGRLAPEAIERTREALTTYVQIMKAEGVTDVRMVATSATRDAVNRDEFFGMTARLLGEIRPGAVAEVISGEEEAALSFRGAVADLDPSREPFCVIDLGGGSTEFIVGTAAGDILGASSVDMGCVRLTERIMVSDPATEAEIAEAEDYVAELTERVAEQLPLAQARTFVGVAGTFTTLSALAQGLETYDRTEIHNSELSFEALQVITDNLIAEPAALRAAHPVIHPGRADVIGGGSVVVNGIIDMISRHSDVHSFVISEKDILDGIVAGLVDRLAEAAG
ncbi:Ppx/GppA phosphatase family protein [Corynebacterium guangdongense]|uniref:Exopolyphosphatase/guanosine-5'-triphosphate, 3'-diphosphate pyrophosphatase n=1 Tax=Corynebacterium guangdongense TaxID=1783348 RepID=A0ABU1ZVF3_9CORY|nr:Ppx/GppA phosphatase family protein [Corynebacterium guangdongense]MDR7328913.1 exopolyphosphatase/guanosine-5'-triphosphate,3'-diphosphate pyrophosphatase [Corynebacterium guangdongense]WJZ17488.1 Guanosine-5'-triphosphate,3'-diphosphate pyrophosphatase [Corynebacterium guangdongense]